MTIMTAHTIYILLSLKMLDRIQLLTRICKQEGARHPRRARSHNQRWSGRAVAKAIGVCVNCNVCVATTTMFFESERSTVQNNTYCAMMFYHQTTSSPDLMTHCGLKSTPFRVAWLSLVVTRRPKRYFDLCQ
jgi:hypothetical protein